MLFNHRYPAVSRLARSRLGGWLAAWLLGSAAGACLSRWDGDQGLVMWRGRPPAWRGGYRRGRDGAVPMRC